MEYKIEKTGYNNTQVVEGYMELSIDNIKEPIYIDVIEVTAGLNHVVFMHLNFNGQSSKHKKDVLSLIRAEKISDKKNCYTINDSDLVKELFSKYGNNN